MKGNNMSNVVSIFKNDKQAYLRRLITTPMANLISEAMHFQDCYARKKSRSRDEVIKGIALFLEIEKRAITLDMRVFAGSYRRTLEEKLKEMR